MHEVGVFEEDDRVELLEGEIIIMAAIGLRHATAVKKLNRLFGRRFAARCIVDCQGPVVLSTLSEPLPDIALESLETLDADHLPTPAEVLLVVEVADSSLAYDSGRKLKAYAAAGVQEFWIVNLVDDIIDIRREPSGDGYRSRTIAHRGESVSVAAFPDVAIAVNDVLPAQA